MNQGSLFEATTISDEACRFPMVAASTGYRYGCRCARCTTAKRGSPLVACQHEGCTAPRQKSRRFCVEHQPARESRRREAPCELCGRLHAWYESPLVNMREEIRDLYRRTCDRCRRLYMGVIRTHRLDTQTAIRLITAERCDLCGCRFSIASSGRRNVHVDHDHFCCPGTSSCGACIRGLLCPRCNHVIASIEGVRDVGLDRALEYLKRYEDIPTSREDRCLQTGGF